MAPETSNLLLFLVKDGAKRRWILGNAELMMKT
jgi:hypothetical protein